MGTSINFIRPPTGDSISPNVGHNGTIFTLGGPSLGDVTGVHFMNMFEDQYPATFGVVDNTKITGQVPLLDGTLGPYKVNLTNEVGKDDICCFYPYITASATMPIIFNSQRNFVKYTYKQIDDKYGINAAIDNAPNKTQGYEVVSVTEQLENPNNLLEIKCELSLQSAFWGAAVLALFKDDETIPLKVWNYSLLGQDMGQIARFTYLDSPGNMEEHRYRIRLGRTHTSYAAVYMNRGVNESHPYYGKTSSYMSISEIEKNTAQHDV